MNREQLVAELTALTQQVGATPCKLRAVARSKLGTNLEYPLIVFGPQGTAMRIYTHEGTIWVPVPESWMRA